MKKIILVAVLLLSSVFYISTTSFKEVGYFDNTGYLFNDNKIQENLYSGSNDIVDSIITVSSDDTLFKRWSSYYVGVDNKNKVNTTYPMFIKDNTAIEFLNEDNILYDVNLEVSKAYPNLIINDGEAFNNDFERADSASYVLARLTNNIYINTQRMEVSTNTHDYMVKGNSFIYFTPEFIRIYYPSDGVFPNMQIDDVSEDTIIKIDELEITYGDLLLKLGETSIVEETDRTKDEVSNKTEEIEENIGNLSPNAGTSNSSGTSTNHGTNSADKDKDKLVGDKVPTKGGAAGEAEKPDIADGSIEAGGQLENPDNKPTVDDSNPEWVKPTVEMLDKYSPTTYTVTSSLKVDDPAGVIKRSSITYEIIIDDVLSPNYGNVLKRQSVKVTSGENKAVVTGLSANSKYSLYAYYYYYEKDGRQSERVDILETPYKFQTKDISELGDVYLNPIDSKNATIYGDRINFPSLSFDLNRSSLDAISGISYITVDVKEGNNNESSYRLGTNVLNGMKNGESVSYTTPTGLRSGKTYNCTFNIYDKDGNLLITKPDNFSYTARTCYKLPSASMNVTKNGQESFTASVKVDNPDNVPINNLHLVLTDLLGNPVPGFENTPINLNNNQGSVTLSNLGLNKNYQIRIVADCDINDGATGDALTRVLLIRKYTTGSLQELGSLYLNFKNISDKAADYGYGDEFKTATRALFEVEINTTKTNHELLEYIDNLSFVMTRGNETYEYVIPKVSPVQTNTIENLINGNKLVIDTDSFIADHLTSNSTYSLLWLASFDSENDPISIDVRAGLTRLVTPRKDIDISVYDTEGFTGYMSFKTKVIDDDNIINGDDLLVSIYKINNIKNINNIDYSDKDLTYSFVGSFRINKNEETSIVLSSDGSSSTDGNSYNIEAGAYDIRFVADEVTLDKLYYNYWINKDKQRTNIKTERGLQLNADLMGLSSSSYLYREEIDSTDYTQLEYVQSTGAQYVNIDYKMKSNTKVDLSYMPTSIAGYQAIFGNSWSGQRFLLNIQSSRWYWHSSGVALATPSTNRFTEIELTKSYITIDGVKTNATDSLAVNSNLYLLGLTSGSYNSHGKLASLQIYEEGSDPVVDLVPVVSKDGIVGLLDLARKDSNGNYLFFKSATATPLAAGPEIHEEEMEFDPVTEFLSKIDVDLKEYDNWLPTDKIYVEINRIIDGKTVLEKNTSFEYNLNKLEWNETEIDEDNNEINYYAESLIFKYPVKKDSNVNNSYQFNFYVLLSNGTRVPLDTVSFSTEEEILTIHNIDEFFAIGSSKNKYVVVNDLEYTASYKGRDDTSTAYGGNDVIHWRNSPYFGARVDFQGHTLDFKGKGPLIYRTTRDASLTNLVFKDTAVGFTTNGTPYGQGTLVAYNYGVISNVYLEYSEDYDYPYKHDTYYTLTNEEKADQYRYMRGGGLTNDNYGVIENFVIKVMDKYTVSGYGGLATLYNHTGGVVRNGYLYSEKEVFDKNGKLTGISYTAEIDVYGSSSNSYFGGVVGYNYTGSTTENIFAIANVNLKGISTDNAGVVVGGNNGIVRNVYAVGDTFANANGTNIDNFKAKVTTYGPTVGNTTTSYTNQNIYAISKQQYIDAKSTNFNTFVSVMSLRNATWQDSVLNNNNRGAKFNVDSLISVNCYPQINYSSECMPPQDFIPFDDYIVGNEIDVVYSYTYNTTYDESTNLYVGDDPYTDEIFNAYIKNNYPNSVVGDKVWTTPDEFGNTSNIQPVIFLVSDKGARPIDGITVTGLDIDVITYRTDGKGITTVYAVASNPVSAVDRYTVTKVSFKETVGDLVLEEEQLLTATRYLDCTWFRVLELNDAETWISTMHNPGISTTLTQNVYLAGDIDFTGYKLSDVYVRATYRGKFEGNGHKLYGFEFENCDPAKMGSIDHSVGLFKHISGATINDLFIEGLHYEGGKHSGILAGETTGATINNVHVINSSVVGGTNVGGLIGRANQATTINNSSVDGVKILTYGKVDGSDSYVAAGGLVGRILGLTYINNSFADNLYIENWFEADASAIGGLAGYIYDAGATRSEITNSYASGVINGSGAGQGGIVGYVAIDINIENVYSDVDIITYSGNASGIVGRALAGTMPDIHNAVAYGNIISGNLLQGNLDSEGKVTNSRIFNNSLNMIDSAATIDTASFNTSKIDIRYLSSTNVSDYDDYEIVKKYNISPNNSISFDDITSYLNVDTFDLDLDNQVYLPTLKTDLAGVQNKSFISDGANSKISLGNYNYSNNKFTVSVTADSDINVLAVYTDYTYIDEMVGLKRLNNTNELIRIGDNYNSETENQTFKLSYKTKPSKTYGENTTRYDFVYNNANLNTYKDIYKITAIKYEDSTGIHYLKVNKIIDNLYLKFKDINNITDWNNFFLEKRFDSSNTQIGYGSTAENIRIKGDLDFSSESLVLNKNYNNFNVITNRIVGISKNHSDYNDYYLNNNGSDNYPYATISNVKMQASTLAATSGGKLWTYEGFAGLIKSSITELSYLSFDNADIKNPGAVGVIANANGIVHDLTFTNCKITGTTTRIFSALMDVVNAETSNVYVGDTTITGASHYGGIFAALSYNMKGNKGFKNIIVENSSFKKSGNYNYSGGIVGSVNSMSYNYILGKSTTTLDDSTFTISDCKVINSSISGYAYVSAITGNISNAAYFNNNEVIGTKLKGTNNFIAGVAGSASNDYARYNDNYIYNSDIRGISYVGGISGIRGIHKNNTVEDTLVVGTTSYVGGLAGQSTGTWVDVVPNQGQESNSDVAGWVINSKIYGNTHVGGLFGYGTNSTDVAGFVKDSEVYGNTYVGGAIGHNSNAWIGTPYISNTLIAPVRPNSYNVPTSTSPSYFGGITGYGGRAAGFVDNCVIGADNVNYVGGLLGRIDYYEGTSINYNSICRDSVVIGNNYVGGLYGQAITKIAVSGNSYYQISTSNYSNAYVVGNDYVAGIAGNVTGFKASNSTSYVNMPVLEYSYFTGTLTSKNNASAIFGTVTGNTTLLKIQGLVSMPDSISAKHVEAVLIDQNILDNTFAYNWATSLLNEASNLKVSLWSKTKINLSSDTDQKDASGNITIKTMSDLMKTDKYKDHYSAILETVEADFKAGKKDNRKFIYLFENNGDSSSPSSLRDIPMGYTQLDCIQSSGAQYIDLNYPIKANTKVVLSYMPTSITGNQAIIGSSWSGNRFLLNIQSSAWNWHGGTSPYKLDIPIKTNDYTEFELTKNYIKLDGVQINKKDSLADGNKLYLMGLSGGTYSNGRLRSLKIYEDGTEPVVDLVPVVNDDGVVGLLDLKRKDTNNKNLFLTSKTTTPFVAGKPLINDGVITRDWNYIGSNIMGALSGPGAVVEANKYWIYNQKLYEEGLMPLVGDGSGLTFWNNLEYNSHVNTITGTSLNLKIRQGVPMPETPKFNAEADIATSVRYNLFSNYKKYLNGELTYEDFKGDLINGEYIPSEGVAVVGYAAGVDVLNIDVSSDDVASYTELEYIESTGTQYIDTGYTLGRDSKVETKFNLTSTTGSLFGSFQGGSPWTHLTYYGSYYIGSSGFGSVVKTGEHEFISEITSPDSFEVTIDGVVVKSGKYTGNLDNYTYKLFASGNTGNWKGYGQMYYFKMYDNDEQVRNYVPVISNNGEVGLYDTIEKKFYGNKGTGTFIAGPVKKDDKGNPIRHYLYDIAVEGVNSQTKYVEKTKLNSRTISIGAAFDENLKVTITKGDTIISTTTIYVNNLVRRVSTVGDRYYYIDFDGSVRGKDDYSLVPSDSATFINVYGNKALDSKGNVYDLGTKTEASRTTVTESVPLQTFNHEGNDYYRFGTYTLINNSGKITTKDNRWFKFGNSVPILNSNSTGTFDDYFRYVKGSKFIEIYLRNSGLVKDIGTLPVEGHLEDFNNSKIKHMSSNYSDGSQYVLFEYKDGSVVGFDADTGEKVVDMTNNNNAPLGMSLFSFLGNSFDGLFSMGSVDSKLMKSRTNTQSLVNLMNETGADLDDVLSVLSTVDDISGVINDGEIAIDLTNIIGTDDGNVESGLGNPMDGVEVIEEESLGITFEDYGLLPLIEGLTDEYTLSNKVEEKEFIKNEVSEKYVAIYNEETNDFDIYSTEELINSVDEPISENSKVVDKATLKALYSALGEDDKNERNGVVLYVLVAVAITLLALIVMVLDSIKKGKGHN